MGIERLSTKALPHDEWLALRRRGIGGSDAAKVLGISRWGGPLTVYMDKLGLLPPEEEQSEAAYWGTTLEEVVAREFTRRSGLRVRRKNAIVHHKNYPWMIANVDREVVGTNKGLECKTVSAYKADEWTGDEVPDAYYIQCQHYMAVMEWESCYIAALVGGQRFVFKEILRNDEEINFIIDAERLFWEDHVVPRIPPLAGLFDDAGELFPSQTGDDLETPTDEDLLVAREMYEIREKLKPLEDEKMRLEAYLKTRIGERAGLDGVATWKQAASRVAVDWEGLAMSLNPSREQIEAHTAVKAGTRRFSFKFKPLGLGASDGDVGGA
jgi:putative phage-type endonuclease